MIKLMLNSNMSPLVHLDCQKHPEMWGCDKEQQQPIFLLSIISFYPFSLSVQHKILMTALKVFTNMIIICSCFWICQLPF